MSLQPIIEIRFESAKKTYKQNDSINGLIVVTNKVEFKHDGISLDFEGLVNLQPSKSGVLDAFSNIKPIELTKYSTELCKSGRLPAGKSEYSFEILLEEKQGRFLYETYHGIHIAVQYVIRCEIKRSFPNKSTVKNGEILVQYRVQKDKAIDKPVTFTITPESLPKSNKRDCGKFLITGKIDSCSCLLTKPFTGEITIKQCDKEIKSIELQLVRVETVGSNGDYTKESSEIQTIQIGVGDVARELAIPIFMIFPRLFTCPTVETPNFRIEFEVFVHVIFVDDIYVSESFPITLHRF